MKVRNKVDTQWITAKMSEMIDINPKEKLSKGTYAKKISMDKLQPFCRDVPEFEIAEFIGGTKFRNGDTIMARITPCLENGKTAMVNILEPDEVGFGSTEFIVFRAKEGCMDPDFVYYLIKSPIVREPAIKSMVGSSGRQRVQTEVLQNLVIPFPSLSEQRKIGSLLKTLDDKIAINTKINNNLMQQAKMIFEAEIVNRTELPNGWEKSNLASIADYLNGLAMQNYRPTDDDQGFPVLKIKELRQGACDADSERCSSYIKSNYIVNDGDVIFSWSGSLLVDFWCGGICGLNQHLFKVTSTQYAPWFFYSWTNYHLAKFAAIASAKATTMGHIKRSDIEAAEVVIPSSADYERIGALIQPLYNLCISLRLENRKLAATRDSLLPRLLSGDIDISETII